MTIIIGSRESELAMVQSKQILSLLSSSHKSMDFVINGMTTKGDEIQNVSLSKIGAKSLFTKELEVALDNKLVHLVVHSLKDLGTTLPDGMELAAITERVDPRDSVVMSLKNKGLKIQDLKDGSVIGTSSVRRIAQLKRAFPGLVFKDVRGNLNTRLKKLDAEDSPYHALILAYAGWDDRVSQLLDSDEMMYAVGQGALGIECRADDIATQELCAALDHLDTRLKCTAERSFMRELEGGCSVPLGVYTELLSEDGVDNVKLKLIGSITALDGQKQLKHEMTCILKGDRAAKIEAASQLGIAVAMVLKDAGAVEMLQLIRSESEQH